MNLVRLHSLWYIIALIVLMPYCKTSTPESHTIDCNSLLISPIADQVIVGDTRSYLPIAVLSRTLDDITFTLSEGDSYVNILPTQRGRAILIIDAPLHDIGDHNIRIDVSNGNQNACLSFKLKITNRDHAHRVIHCDPNQNNEGDGSLTIPYPSLSQLIASGFTPKTHDLFILHNGNHGNVTLSGSNYTLTASNQNTVSLTSLTIKNAKNLKIQGLEIRPKEDNGDHDQYLVLIDSTSESINFTNNLIVSTDNATAWTQEDWTDRASRGVKCRGDNCIIQNNLLQHVFHGIKTEGKGISVNYNHVDRFGGDAIRNTGSNNVYKYNYLTNATVDDYYDEGGNHDDLFQSWTFDKPIDSITLSNNIMVSCIDTLMPQRAKIVQGLVCFDGFATNWKVSNNLVVTDHPHGIALYGAENCIVSNNIVLKNPYDLYQYESDPWIMINNHKDGRKSKNNIVKANTTAVLNMVSKDVSLSQNILLDSILTKKINNYDQWDFRLKK